MALSCVPDTETAQTLILRYGFWFGKIDFDNSYPAAAGGYSLPDNFKFSEKFTEIKLVTFEAKNGYMPEYDSTNEKIKVYVSGGTEVANATNLSGLTDVGVKVEGWL